VIDSAPAPAPLSRRERKKQDARRRIYQAAVHLFIEKGFETTTVDEIADRADVAKGTVFNYFPHKTSFLAALADDWTDRVTDALGPVHRWRGTTRGKLERLFRYLADVGAENPAVSCLALLESLRDVPSSPGSKPPGNEGQVQHFYELTRAILRLGQAHGELRREVCVEHAASLIESGFFCTLARWLLAEDTRPALHQEMAAKLDIVLNGLVARGRGLSRAPSRPPHQRGR
jgi:AcrR family transcriptional regulator